MHQEASLYFRFSAWGFGSARWPASRRGSKRATFRVTSGKFHCSGWRLCTVAMRTALWAVHAFRGTLRATRPNPAATVSGTA